MSLKQWAANGWLKPHETSLTEIKGLFAVVEPDLKDAGGDVSADWRFSIAYNAALKLATILLYAEGYRPDRNLQHYRTIHAIPLILGIEHQESAEYLDACRKKRNTSDYEMPGVATDDDTKEIIDFVLQFRDIVRAWLETYHSELL
jgi:hypothetical protein